MRTKAIIVEDEPKAQKHLQNLIGNLEGPITIMACLASVRDTIDWLTSNPMPHLIFMDIQLSDGLSFEILDDVMVSAPIIFTTAYDKYAIQAFKTTGIDYLLKPVTQESMNAAIAAFYRRQHEATTDWISKNIDALNYYRKGEDIASYKQRFLMKLGDSWVPILTREIAYFFRQEIVFAKTFTGELFPMNTSLGQLQSQVDPKQFVRLNRQILTNVEAIGKLKSSKPGQLILELTPAYHEKIEISQERSSWLKQFLDSDA